jgi:hypothetical protein
MNFLLSLLLLVAPAPVKTEHGRFNSPKDGKNIGIDESDGVQTGQTNFPVFVPQDRRIGKMSTAPDRAHMTLKLGKCTCRPLSIATAR